MSLWRPGMVAVSLAAALMLSACSKKEASLTADPISTASTSMPADTPSFKRTEELGKRWQADQSDVRTGLAYADSLKQLGQAQAQLEVLKTLATRNAGNAEVQSSVGKQVLAAGDAEGAAAMLERAVQLNPQNWQNYSALGAAYDQMGRNGEARAKYQQALALKPGDLTVINNMAMSHALQGQLPEAEKLLREALAMPGARTMPRIRQNLALVVGLQGRFDEAEKIASQDLPPDQVAANMAYLKKMLSQPDTWSQLKTDG